MSCRPFWKPHDFEYRAGDHRLIAVDDSSFVVGYDLRVCLRCKRIEACVPVGGGWGGWVEIGERDAARLAAKERGLEAEKILAETP